MPNTKTKVLMIAFELPPFNSGGLGEACLGLTKSLAKHTDITFLLPKKLPYKIRHMKLIFGDEFKKQKLSSKKVLTKKSIIGKGGYISTKIDNNNAITFDELSEDLVNRALKEDFDIIHAHDWMSVKTAIKIKEKTNKKLILQIHSTEIDRSPINGLDPVKYGYEKLGMEAADKVIAVSNYTKSVIKEFYNIPEEKIEVVHNAPNQATTIHKKQPLGISSHLVIYVGRITYQKGMHQFIETAKKIKQEVPDVVFAVLGNGDMYEEVIHKACNEGLTGNIIFTGFLRGVEKDKVMQNAKLLIMPSVSEPFGLVAVEAAQHSVPVIISKQSGVGEVLKSSVKADFWDTDLMAKKAIQILTIPKKHKALSTKLAKELQNITWDNSAVKCNKIYSSLL